MIFSIPRKIKIIIRYGFIHSFKFMLEYEWSKQMVWMAIEVAMWCNWSKSELLVDVAFALKEITFYANSDSEFDFDCNCKRDDKTLLECLHVACCILHGLVCSFCSLQFALIPIAIAIANKHKSLSMWWRAADCATTKSHLKDWESNWIELNRIELNCIQTMTTTTIHQKRIICGRVKQTDTQTHKICRPMIDKRQWFVCVDCCARHNSIVCLRNSKASLAAVAHCSLQLSPRHLDTHATKSKLQYTRLNLASLNKQTN